MKTDVKRDKDADTNRDHYHISLVVDSLSERLVAFFSEPSSSTLDPSKSELPGQRSPKYQHEYGDCLKLLILLRESGVLVHQWQAVRNP